MCITFRSNVLVCEVRGKAIGKKFLVSHPFEIGKVMRACGFYFLFHFFLYMISLTRMRTEGLGRGAVGL